MTYKHSYQIASLPRQTIGEDEGVITEIHVAITVTDGVNAPLTLQAFAYSIPEEDRQPPYTDLSELTKEDILSWVPVETKAEWEATMDRALAAKIEADAASKTTDVPAHLT